VYGIVDIYLRPLRRDLRDLRAFLDLRALRAFLDLRRDDLLLRRLPPFWAVPLSVIGGGGVNFSSPGKLDVVPSIANEIYTTRRKRCKNCLKIIWNEENAK